MKKYKFNKNGKSIVIQSSLMAGIMFITGCTPVESKQDNTESFSTTSVVNETNITESIAIENTITPTPVVYDFVWDDITAEGFLNYFSARFNGLDLPGYINKYGFNKNVEIALTDYINYVYNRDYETVPFSKVNYFRSYHSNSSRKYHYYHGSYDSFSKSFFNPEDIQLGTFNNRLVMTYLIENNIPFGTKIPIENFLSFYGDNIYSFDHSYYYEHMDDGNSTTCSYTSDDLFLVLSYYNSRLTFMCIDEGIYDYDLFSTDPDLKDICDEAREMYQGYMNDFYGENGPQFGVVPTVETYKAMFPGDELIDISIIQGSVYDPSSNEIVSLPPDIDYESIGTIDEELLGEWTGYIELAGFTYIYEFYDDNTGTYTATHSTTDGSQQTNTVNFKYATKFGIVTLEFEGGNIINYPYKITDVELVLNDTSYDHTSSVRSR